MPRRGRSPADDKLLALAIMREERTAEETPEFEIGFDMLHMRFAGEDGAAASMENCGWVLGIAVRMAGELQENISEDVKRVCDEPAADRAGDQCRSSTTASTSGSARCSASRRQSPLAMAVLISSLRPVAPEAAEALAGYDERHAPRTAGRRRSRLSPRTGRCRSAPSIRPRRGFDPFAHWMVAMEAERAGAGAARLADALFHYAYAERLFDAAGRACRRCRSSSAGWRWPASSPTTWCFDVFKRLEAAPLDPAAAGVAEPPLREVPLDDVSDWLATVAGGDEATAKRLQSLVGAGRGAEGRRDRRQRSRRRGRPLP